MTPSQSKQLSEIESEFVREYLSCKFRDPIFILLETYKELPEVFSEASQGSVKNQAILQKITGLTQEYYQIISQWVLQ